VIAQDHRFVPKTDHIAMAKLGRNEPCPCGSGKKLKKCCGDPRAAVLYTSIDRQNALEWLNEWIDTFAEGEWEDAADDLWGRYLDQADELPPELMQFSQAVEDMWCAFDYIGERGAPLVDAFMAEAEVGDGERAFLTALRNSSMRLYEVVDAVPGVSLTLRDAIEGGQVTVNERTGSRMISRHEYVAARVVPRGPSGGPEIEAGLLSMPGLVKDSVAEQLREHRARFLDEHRGASIDEFYKTMPPFFHDVWVGAFLDPYVPTPKTTDGEDMIPTEVQFDVSDGDAVSRALDDHPEIERNGEIWTWCGKNREGKTITLGTLERRGERLVLETLSVERADRGREMLESIAGSALRHRATSHDNLHRAVKERLRAKYLRGEDSEPDESGVGDHGLSPEIVEPLILGHYATHYRAWIDEPVPALDGATPRDGARDPKLRQRTIELVQGLLAIYQNALRRGEPAYDPSWMWGELGLVEDDAAHHPPPLAYERVAGAVAASADLVRAVAERIRGAPDFDEVRTVLTPEAEAIELDVQRFVRGDGAAAAPYLRTMINHELHRRKTFWVDEALAYMLDQTELDVVGGELRMPFASFALVFTDRHMLSLAERLLAREGDSPLAGHLLRVATIDVTECQRGGSRVLEVCFAFDALGADLPALVRHEIVLDDESRVQSYLDTVAPLPAIDPPPPDTHPVRGLLRTTINAILYATSAGVSPERKSPPASRRPNAKRVFSSDDVFYLPGTINISHVRKLQELERAPEGRVLMRRYMVRGHWRRAAKTWTDLRLRWIEPYWKGPDMAAIIERAYRLKE
jgi:hypothetical protein